jgi:hypothetical protein
MINRMWQRSYSKRMPVLQLVHDIRAERMKASAGLQVADFLAWHTNRDFENKERPENDLEAALRRVLTARCVGDLYDYEKLLQLYDKWRPAAAESP